MDLTKLSDVMGYSELSQIIAYPESYMGKTIWLTGRYTSFYSEVTEKTYYSVILMDQTACCGLAMEFVLKKGIPLPEENA